MIRLGTATFIQTLNFAANRIFHSVAAGLSGFRVGITEKTSWELEKLLKKFIFSGTFWKGVRLLGEFI